VRVALYGSTGLPIIVAVTSVAVSNGQMSQANSSLLVAGGAVTVLLLPLVATLLGGRSPGNGGRSCTGHRSRVRDPDSAGSP
jgi:hypothetical protein